MAASGRIDSARADMKMGAFSPAQGSSIAASAHEAGKPGEIAPTSCGVGIFRCRFSVRLFSVLQTNGCAQPDRLLMFDDDCAPFVNRSAPTGSSAPATRDRIPKALVADASASRRKTGRIRSAPPRAPRHLREWERFEPGHIRMSCPARTVPLSESAIQPKQADRSARTGPSGRRGPPPRSIGAKKRGL